MRALYAPTNRARNVNAIPANAIHIIYVLDGWNTIHKQVLGSWARFQKNEAYTSLSSIYWFIQAYDRDKALNVKSCTLPAMKAISNHNRQYHPPFFHIVFWGFE